MLVVEMYTALLELASGNYFFFAKEFGCFLTALKKKPNSKIHHVSSFSYVARKQGAQRGQLLLLLLE